MPPLPRRFYARDAATVARDLLGKVLERDVGGIRRRARITETEAYVGTHDLASHSRHGRTARNASMFGRAGHAYVYFVYGMHHCLNVVTGEEGAGEAVLLRAAEPLDGWAARLHGPALLAQAFAVARADDGADLVGAPAGSLRVLDGPGPEAVAVTKRVGVAYAGDWAHAPLRFLAVDGLDPQPRNPRNQRKPSPFLDSVDSVARSARAAATASSESRARPSDHVLAQQHCEPCSRATPPVPADEARQLLRELHGWRLGSDGKRISREWRLKDFRAALALANAIGELAEQEGHHPDLHLTDYKRLRVELSTHAIRALSRNDFVLAAKIDRLPASAG